MFLKDVEPVLSLAEEAQQKDSEDMDDARQAITPLTAIPATVSIVLPYASSLTSIPIQSPAGTTIMIFKNGSILVKASALPAASEGRFL